MNKDQKVGYVRRSAGMTTPRRIIPPMASSIPGPDEFEVEEILAKKVIKNKKRTSVLFKVKWVGYPESEATWEPAENIHAPKLIQHFEEQELRKKAETEGGKVIEMFRAGPENKICYTFKTNTGRIIQFHEKDAPLISAQILEFYEQKIQKHKESLDTIRAEHEKEIKEIKEEHKREVDKFLVHIKGYIKEMRDEADNSLKQLEELKH